MELALTPTYPNAYQVEMPLNDVTVAKWLKNTIMCITAAIAVNLGDIRVGGRRRRTSVYRPKKATSAI